jgi:hypothetical protein
MGSAGEVTVAGKSNVLIGVFGGAFPLIAACAPVGSGVVRAMWVLVWLAAIVMLFVRALGMGVSATTSGLTVHNLGRDYFISWREVASIDAGRSDNISGAVTTITIRRSDGSSLIARGASSYSRRAVEHCATSSSPPGAHNCRSVHAMPTRDRAIATRLRPRRAIMCRWKSKRRIGCGRQMQRSSRRSDASFMGSRRGSRCDCRSRSQIRLSHRDDETPRPLASRNRRHQSSGPRVIERRPWGSSAFP